MGTLKDIELTEFSNHKDAYIRKRAAEDLNATKELLEKLWNDKSWLVCRAVAGNPNTPPIILAILAHDHIYMEIRRAVAGNSEHSSHNISNII